MPAALVLSQNSALLEAQRFVDMDTGKRKRTAAAACRDRDTEALSRLTIARLAMRGRAGAHISPHTAATYRSAIRAFVDATQQYNLLHLSSEEAALVVRGWEAGGLSTSTIRVRMAAIRALFEALRWAKATDANPLTDVAAAADPTPAHEKRHPYPDEDVNKLLAQAGPEDRALVLLEADGGLRVAESMALQWTRVQLDEARLTVWQGKGRKTRSVAMSPRLVAALRELDRTNEYVIASYRTPQQARNRLKRLCKRAGVTYRANHSFRHTAGTRIYRETGKLEYAQRHLGHSNIKTTQVYAHWSDDRLRAVLDQWE